MTFVRPILPPFLTLTHPTPSSLQTWVPTPAHVNYTFVDSDHPFSC
jgi:hypothetical protein